MAAPTLLGQTKVWVMPAYVAGTGYYFPWNLGAIVEEARLIPERVSNRAGGMGTASFRWLRANREEGNGPFYDGGFAVTGVYVAVTLSGSSFVLSNVVFWGFISRNDISEIAGGNDKAGSVTALGLGYILDGTQCSGWRQAVDAQASVELSICPPFNIQGLGGAIVGNKATDSAGIPVAASLPNQCATLPKFSRLDVLNHFFKYCKPAAIPALSLTGNAAIGTYLASSANQTVFELENLTLRGVIDLMINRSGGLAWQINPNAAGGWDIFAYALNDNASIYDSSFPSATATNVDFSGNISVDVSYTEDASDLYDGVTVQGAAAVFGVSVAQSDGNLTAGWSAGAQASYKAGASGDAGYLALTPQAKAERNEQLRQSPGLSDVFRLFTIPTSSTNILRSATPGAGAGTLNLIPSLTWNGATLTIDATTSALPYLPTLTIERNVPWFMGVSGNGSDYRTSEAKAAPYFMEPTVYQFAQSPATGYGPWANLSLPWMTRHGATITPDDRSPGLRIHLQPQEILAKADWSDANDGITKLENGGVIGTKIVVDPLFRTLDWRELVATVGLASGQRVSVAKNRYGVPANQSRRNLIVTDEKLQCWITLAGTVVGVTAAGQPDRVAVDTTIRNDFPQAERLCAMLAAWLFRRRSSISITLSFAQLFPTWAYIGNMIGQITESGATGPYSSIVTDSYTVIESIDYTFGDHPRCVINTTIPPMPERMQGAIGSSPTSGGAVSASLGGTVAQAAGRANRKIAEAQLDSSKTPTSIGRPGLSSGGAGDAVVVRDVPLVAHGFVVGDIITGVGGSWVKAKATTVLLAGYTGMVSKADAADLFDLTLAGVVSGLSGKATGTVYYLSGATAGASLVVGSLGATHLRVPVYLATSATTAYLFATSMNSEDLSRLVLGDVTTGGGTLHISISATVSVDIDSAGKVVITYANSNTVTIDSADFVGTGRAVKLREIDVCESGVAKKMLMLASAAY